MESRTRETLIGLFVTFGLLVAVGGVVWLGASDVLRGGAGYVAYFDQSVGAIAAGSPVKYMGLEIGSVARVEVAPDPTLMTVVMRIRRPGLVTDHTVAEIQTVGFTGVGFVELSPQDEVVRARSLSFKPPLPVIPSRTSGGFGAIAADAGRIADTLTSLDLPGVVRDLRAVLRSVKDEVSDPAIHRTVSNLASASERLDEITVRVDRVVSSDGFAELPGQAGQTLRAAQGALADARKQIRSLQLAQTSQRVGRAAETVDRRSQRVATQAEALLQDLRQAADSLNRLLERLDQDPSALVFGQPAPPRPGADADKRRRQ